MIALVLRYCHSVYNNNSNDRSIIRSTLIVYGWVVVLSVVSFKVRREIKEKMEKYRDRVNWAEELRRFVEERIRRLEAEENIRRVMEELERIPVQAPAGFSRASVREDRDSS